jgi:hypothetical protein
MDNEVKYGNYEKHQINQNIFCNRCRLREGDFTCHSCDPFQYFCANCDGYVHSSASKRLHVRKILEKIREKVGSVDFDNLKSFSTNHRTIGNNLDNSYTNNNILSVGDYVNMKTMQGNSFMQSPGRSSKPDFEKEQLQDKISALENQLENVQSILNEKISNLEIHLEENNKKYNLNLKILNDEHSLEIRKILNEKDGEIRSLKKKNMELDKLNCELNFKLEQSNLKLNQVEIELKEFLNRNELNVKKREYDFEELKNYNDNRIKLISENFAQEKTKLINYYERNIDKLNNGYKESKEKYLSLLSQRENDIKEIIMKMKNEEKYF